jgi:hypothetical protein
MDLPSSNPLLANFGEHTDVSVSAAKENKALHF